MSKDHVPGWADRVASDYLPATTGVAKAAFVHLAKPVNYEGYIAVYKGSGDSVVYVLIDKDGNNPDPGGVGNEQDDREG